jgi:predicted dinucleotide-binding enzyme
MKIGIIGSGSVGQLLGDAFISEGHEVMLGTRNPQKEEVVKWQQENQQGRTGTFEETAVFSEIVVLAVAGVAAEEALKISGANNLSGKVVIDATNPIAHEAPVNGVLKFFTSLDDSLMERLQKLVPNAHFVKAFNSVGAQLMYKPKLGGTPTMFICGNNAEAKKKVTQILDTFGWETEDLGFAEAARAIEPLCILWCIPGFLNNQWMHAFKLLRS